MALSYVPIFSVQQKKKKKKKTITIITIKMKQNQKRLLPPISFSSRFWESNGKD